MARSVKKFSFYLLSSLSLSLSLSLNLVNICQLKYTHVPRSRQESRSDINCWKLTISPRQFSEQRLCLSWCREIPLNFPTKTWKLHESLSLSLSLSGGTCASIGRSSIARVEATACARVSRRRRASAYLGWQKPKSPWSDARRI